MDPPLSTEEAAQLAQALRARAARHKRLAALNRRLARETWEQLRELETRCDELGIALEVEVLEVPKSNTGIGEGAIANNDDRQFPLQHRNGRSSDT